LAVWVRGYGNGQQCRRFADPALFALTSVHECRDIQQEADMTPRIPENVSSWSFATIMGNTMPPREPNDDDDDAEDEEGDAEPDDLEPAVIREPDE
jgi:hypothetical protein